MSGGAPDVVLIPLPVAPLLLIGERIEENCLVHFRLLITPKIYSVSSIERAFNNWNNAILTGAPLKILPKISIDKVDLKTRFRNISTSYLFLTTSAHMDHVSIDMLQSLATSLNLPFTTQHVLTIAELAPELVTFTVDDGTIFLKLRVRLAKNAAVKSKLKAIDKICEQFESLIDKCQLQLCETGYRPVKKQKIEFDLLLKRSWEEMTNCLVYDEFFTSRFVESWLVPAKNARYEELEIPLHAAVNEAVKMEGISQFYSHQAAAIDLIAQGDDLVLPTATSSGKSLVYQVGIAQKAIMDSDQCFLLIFPTKALAQDQKSRLKNFMSNAGIECDIETFDGDTPSDRRENIRSSTRILLTNPDMLHVAILPHHYLWSRFLKNIRLVIIDEIHYYHGNFGAAFSMVIMRLLRICKLYGNTDLQFIGCSATIYDPVDHFSALIGKNRKVCLACRNSETFAGDGDGSPFAEKMFVVYRTLIHDSLVLQAIKTTVFLLAQGVRTLVFAKTRSMCEVLYKEMQNFCEVHAPNLDVSRKVLPYRGGYSPQERRQIERKLFDSQLLGVISTNALEVGVDIGSLDAVVNVGYPSSNASFYQQAGRAGRRGKKSLNILFLDSFNWNDSIYLKKNELIRERGLQRLAMDTNDETMINIQLNCAAQEIPIPPNDEYFFGQESPYHQACLEYLRHDPVPNVYIPLAKYNNNPAYLHPIRLVPDPVYELINLRNGQLVEEIEKSRVPFTLYPGIYKLIRCNSSAFRQDMESKNG